MSRRVVIVGGGMSTATGLRRLGEGVTIVVLEASDHVSYASVGSRTAYGTIAGDDLVVLAAGVRPRTDPRRVLSDAERFRLKLLFDRLVQPVV